MKRIIHAVLFVLLGAVAVHGQLAVTAQTALQAYVHNNDPTWGWEVRKSYQVEKTSIYSLFFLSQKWHGILWKHELIVFVPQSLQHDGALLFIDGGSLNDGIPHFSKGDDGLFPYLSALANRNQALVCVLKQVPNQPLFGGLKEDALISYTLNEFRKDNDYSWPLLFPMTKSAYNAMTAIQEFATQQLGHPIRRFLLSGGSKRGWTAWLAGSLQDPRVKAIAPMVIDMLNMPVTLDYQKQLYGEYSEEIRDYVDLEIPQAIHSEFGTTIVAMIDPYSYRKKLELPKMLIMGTNDPYWTLDAVKHYIDDIPGQNLLHYVPNVGHGLGDKTQAFGALGSFFACMLHKMDYPSYQYTLEEKGRSIRLKVNTSPHNLIGARLWTSVSGSRDFRKAMWTKKDISLSDAHKSVIEVKIEYPGKGFQAFYLDLVYKDPQGTDYTVSTRTYVSDSKEVFVR